MEPKIPRMTIYCVGFVRTGTVKNQGWKLILNISFRLFSD